MNRATASQIATVARDEGMRTLREDGWRKVKMGVTTLEEVLRVTQSEEHARSLGVGEKSEPA